MRPSPKGRAQRRRLRDRRRKSLRGASLVRLRVGFVVIAMVVSIFGARLFQLQGIDAKAYAAKAEAAGLVTVTLPATRGAITDRTGTPLAESVDGLMIVADPTKTRRNAGAIAQILAGRLGLDYFEVLERLRKPRTQFQYIARRVPSTTARAVVEEIDAKEFKGIDVRRDPVRDYPAKDVAANILGFMGSEGQAMDGFELLFDDILDGIDGSTTYEQGGGNRIPLGDNSVVEPESGEDLVLTIDRDVQWYTQRVLRQAVQASGGDSGAAVVMDTRTGELLALADYPTFDANNPQMSLKKDLGARSLFDVYEPGSVEKVLTAAALIDDGKVTPDTRISVPNQISRQDRVINDYWDHGRLRLTLTGVIAKSSNIGTVLAADEFTPRQLHRYLSSFGLGDKTDIGLAGEAPGILPPWQSWQQINQDTIAFGQGVSVTALQMAAAVNAIANGGVLVEPSLVKGTATTANGETVGSDTVSTRRVVSKRAARLTSEMMEAVTDPEEGTAPAAAIEGYRVAGKTGTAQRVGEDGLGYDGTFTVSFAGFAPADDPRFLVYVVVQDPKNGGGGGTIGGPVFNQIMTYLLRKYAVPPTGAQAPDNPLEW
ncbi:MAG: penicillin-binding protein 2 [Actinomycetota bacterium]|nr:penicillin-binding protein 2 [Actinomycetota bacterium]